jgi:hypothetical protein
VGLKEGVVDVTWFGDVVVELLKFHSSHPRLCCGMGRHHTQAMVAFLSVNCLMGGGEALPTS